MQGCSISCKCMSMNMNMNMNMNVGCVQRERKRGQRLFNTHGPHNKYMYVRLPGLYGCTDRSVGIHPLVLGRLTM